MINNLQKDLDQLERNNKLVQQKIATLFYNIKEVSTTFNNNIVFQNHFETLRVEICGIIFDYLDMKTLFAFRLSSMSGNKLILLLLQKKVNNLQHKKEKLQQQLAQQQLESQAVHDSQEANQFLEQFRKDQTGIQSLNSYDICELRALCNPPQVVVKTLELLTILLNYTKQVSWNNSKQLLSNPHSFMSDLIEYDVTTITDKQLEKLQEIHQIHLHPELISMAGLRIFYQYILSIVNLGESILYQILAKQNIVEKLISYIDKQMHFKRFFIDYFTIIISYLKNAIHQNFQVFCILSYLQLNVQYNHSNELVFALFFYFMFQILFSQKVPCLLEKSQNLP